jgi:hypothetical protein
VRIALVQQGFQFTVVPDRIASVVRSESARSSQDHAVRGWIFLQAADRNQQPVAVAA